MKLYLEIEQMRLVDKLQFSIEVSDEVEPDICMIPTMLLQPAAENAIIHGILPKQQGGKVSVSVFEKEDQLKIAIEDDGIGVGASKALKEHSTHQSLGLEMIQKRLRLFSEKFQKLFSVKAEDYSLKGKQGTQVLFTLPVMDASMFRD